MCGHRGVGGALVLDGRLRTGSPGLALEVGHLLALSSHSRLPGGAWHARSRRCRNARTAPLSGRSGALRSHAPDASGPALRADDGNVTT
ncbi:hypothetical protein FBY22_4979 [Streptomyces sp. SLBN-31]|nr:hypothetical protein FBY22_4979 [Streptomyces sp. SLBN-31]